eukprot:GHVU01127064.1.p1 GENE.GHVU01127064.1~~GHVU01127064.1.p1  ORF type:complete len:232 (+),score=34.54 GHVU01127064.1:2354-3049(+)
MQCCRSFRLLQQCSCHRPLWLKLLLLLLALLLLLCLLALPAAVDVHVAFVVDNAVSAAPVRVAFAADPVRAAFAVAAAAAAEIVGGQYCTALALVEGGRSSFAVLGAPALLPSSLSPAHPPPTRPALDWSGAGSEAPMGSKEEDSGHATMVPGRLLIAVRGQGAFEALLPPCDDHSEHGSLLFRRVATNKVGEVLSGWMSGWVSNSLCPTRRARSAAEWMNGWMNGGQGMW